MELDKRRWVFYKIIQGCMNRISTCNHESPLSTFMFFLLFVTIKAQSRHNQGEDWVALQGNKVDVSGVGRHRHAEELVWAIAR